MSIGLQALPMAATVAVHQSVGSCSPHPGCGAAWLKLARPVLTACPVKSQTTAFAAVGPGVGMTLRLTSLVDTGKDTGDAIVIPPSGKGQKVGHGEAFSHVLAVAHDPVQPLGRRGRVEIGEAHGRAGPIKISGDLVRAENQPIMLGLQTFPVCKGSFDAGALPRPSGELGLVAAPAFRRDPARIRLSGPDHAKRLPGPD